METTKAKDDHLSILDIDLARTGEASGSTMEHLQSCADCKARLETLQSLATDFKELAEAEMPASDSHEKEMLAFIVDRAKEIREQTHRPRPLRIYRWIASAAAAIILAIGIRFWPGPTDSGSDSPTGGPQTPIREYAANDLNQDGTTDAIDAYLLATRPEADPTAAEALMRQIVSLDNKEVEE